MASRNFARRNTLLLQRQLGWLVAPASIYYDYDHYHHSYQYHCYDYEDYDYGSSDNVRCRT